MRRLALFLPLVLASAAAADPLVVHETEVADRKAVIATVKPIHQLVARARIGGTIASLSIKEGDDVNAGAVVAQVTDAKLALQMQALDARIASQQATRDEAKTDYDRIDTLAKRDVSTQTQVDQAKTNLDVAERNIAAMKGDREEDHCAMKLGLSGVLTRAFIQSPLTPLPLIAALIAGAIAAVSLPREEEPQISVPLVDIMVAADSYKASEAVELVTRPLEDIVKGIDGVEHVYSQTEDDKGRRHHAIQGRQRRRHRGVARAREDPGRVRPHPRRHSGPVDRRARHQRRADPGADDISQAGEGERLERQRPLSGRGRVAARTDQG